MILFKQKKYSSIKEDILKGAILGSSIGTSLSPLFGTKGIKYATLIGAGLGTLIGALKWSTLKLSQKTDKKRNLDQLGKMLIKLGYKENKDFTKDPKMANLLKTKVCLAFSKSRTEFKLLINSVNDPNLKKTISSIIRKIPQSSFPVVSEKFSEKFSEIQVVSIPSDEEIIILAEMIRELIEHGYPVYFIEVG